MLVQDMLTGYLQEVPDSGYQRYFGNHGLGEVVYDGLGNPTGEVVYDGFGNPVGLFPAIAALAAKALPLVGSLLSAGRGGAPAAAAEPPRMLPPMPLPMPLPPAGCPSCPASVSTRLRGRRGRRRIRRNNLGYLGELPEGFSQVGEMLYDGLGNPIGLFPGLISKIVSLFRPKPRLPEAPPIPAMLPPVWGPPMPFGPRPPGCPPCFGPGGSATPRRRRRRYGRAR
jgi:hypothetical protein